MEIFTILALLVAAYFFWSRQGNRPPDLSLLPAQFIVLDLETTGLNPDRNKIIEIGAIRVNRDSSQHDTFQSLVRINSKIPAKITEITGITDAMLAADGTPLAEALDGFVAFAGDLRLVTFNAEFDMGFLHAAFDACDKPRMRNPVSCALDMARRAWPGRKSYKLKDLASDGNLGAQNHRALGDCQLAMMVYAGAATKLRRID